MHRFSALLVVLVTMATSPQLFAAPRIEDVLPADTSLLLMVEDMPALLEQGSENPLVAVWNHERVRTVLATTRRVIKVDYLDGLLEMGLGYPLKDVLTDLPGQAALAVPKLEGGLGEYPSFGLMARVEDPQRVNDVMDFLLEFAAQRAPEGVQLNNVDEEYFGEVLHLQQIVQDKEVSEGLGWAIVDGMAVIAQPKAYLQELVASIKQGEAESPWSQTDVYQRVRSWAPESDLLLYVNGEGVSHLVKSYLGVGETVEQVEEQEPQVVTLSTIVSELSDVLHFDNIDGLYLAGSLRAEVTVLEINLLYHENNGLVRLLAYEPGPVKLPDFVPDDATNVTVSLFSLPAVWKTLKETAGQMKTLEGPYTQLQAQLQSVSQQAGFDVEKALLSSMGNEVVGMDLPRPGDRPEEDTAATQADTLYALEITDHQSMRAALDAVLAQTGWAALLERHDYLETPLYTFKRTAADGSRTATGSSPSYALTDNYLLYASSPHALQRVLSSLARPNGSSSVWQQPAVKNALSELPENASEIAVYEPSQFLYDALNYLATTQLRWENRRECGQRPRLESDLFDDRLETVISASYKDSGSYRLRYHFHHGEKP